MDELTQIIADDWPRWSRSRPVLLQPLAGGLTNRSYLLEAEQQLLVLRINSPASSALDLNRAAELQAVERAHTAALCAPLVYCDPHHRYLVTRFIEGTKWRCNNDAALSRLALLVRAIHELPPLDISLDVDEKIAHYWHSITSDAPLYSALRSLQRKVREHLHSARSLATAPVLCHNDLLADNLIESRSGALQAIDWEYAASGDPFYELAVIVEGHSLSPRHQQVLLQTYQQRELCAHDWQRLQHWRVIYGYLSLLWYAVQYSVTELGASQITADMTDQLQRLKKLMEI